MKYLVTTLLILVMSLNLSNCANDTCKSYTCNDSFDKKGLCATQETVGGNVQLYKCHLLNQFCNMSTLDANKTAACERNHFNPKYINGSCQDSSDCLNGLECSKDKVCTPLTISDTCSKHSECKIGEACIDKTCQKQITPGENNRQCKTDMDCINKAGCKDNKCIYYFSLNAGEAVVEDKKNFIGIFSFCKSSFSRDGICEELTLFADIDCVTNGGECIYYKFDNTRISTSEYCECGFNDKKSKSCRLFQGNLEMKPLNDAYINLLSNPNCHTEERKDCSVYLKENLKDLKLVDQLKADLENSHQFDKSNKKCFAKILYPLYEDKEFSPICPSYDCKYQRNKNDTQTCSIKTNHSDSVKFSLHSCDANSTCNVFNSHNEKCKPLPVQRRYPGTTCETDDQCISGSKCNQTTKLCENKKENDICTSNKECPIGLTCRTKEAGEVNDKQCLPQLDIAADCSSDYDCKNNLGCHQNKCIKYFSVKNGKSVVENDNKLLSFCESGFSHANTCYDVVNLISDKDCTDTNECIYQSPNRRIFKRNDFCECASNGRKKCRLLHGDINALPLTYLYSSYLDQSNCHTEERLNCYNANISDEGKQINEKTSITKYLNTEAFKIDKLTTCLANFQFNLKETIENSECPKFNCTTRFSKKTPCVNIEIDEETKKKKATLSRCYRKDRCLYDPLKLIDSETTDYKSSCERKETKQNSSVYPGEICENDNQCVPIEVNGVKVQKCVSGKCKGIESEQFCKSSFECNSGFYCGEDNKCNKLKEKGVICHRTSECNNSLACNGVCQEYNIVKVGQQLENYMYLSKLELEEEAKYNCEFGIASKIGICIKRSYFPKSNDEVVKCNPGDKCLYKTQGNGDYYDELDCLCGFNEDGQGYCPYSTDGLNHDKILKSLALHKNGSTCHTLNRFKCNNEVRTIDYIHDLAAGDVRFYNSPDSCVYNVLLSSKWLSLSIISVLALLLVLL